MLGRQRLRIGDVEGRADPAGRGLGQQRVGVDQLAAGDVDQQRPIGQRGQLAAPIIPSVSGVCGAIRMTTSAIAAAAPADSSMACTCTGSVAGRRATRVTDATSKPASRRSMAAPMWP